MPKITIELDVLIGIAEFWKLWTQVEKISDWIYIIYTTVGPILCGQDQKRELNKASNLCITICASNIDSVPANLQTEQFWAF